MKPNYKVRRLVALLVIAIVSLSGVAFHVTQQELSVAPEATPNKIHDSDTESEVVGALALLEVKGRAPKTGYERSQFGSGWESRGGCDVRNLILQRDLEGERVDEECKVLSGVLHDPYTGETINFIRGQATSADVQIDHVVALSNAWQTGAQLLTREQREAFANDPLNLLAVDGSANQQKSDGDAATWLPSNKAFRCQYVARQVAVKQAYGLWVVPAEKAAILRVLEMCPGQSMPIQ